MSGKLGKSPKIDRKYLFHKVVEDVFPFRAILAIVLSGALLATPAFASHVKRAPTAGTSHRKAKTRHSHRRVHHILYRHRIRGQQAIQPDRVKEIQAALIKARYLDGQPSGDWDQTTISAMQKYQADHGWQTRLMPDARALVKLGLGPDYSNAINAQSASFTAPPPVNTIPQPQVAGFEAASGAN